jgi:serine protease Do
MGMQFRELADWVRRRKFFAGVLVMFTLAIGILIGTLISGRAMATRSQAGNGAALLAIPDPVSLSGTFSAIAGKLEPTVVNISTTQVIDRPKGKQKRKPGDPFDDFFDRFFDNQDEGPAAERSLGSGVVVDAKGYILTNNHVVDQATKILATTWRKLSAPIRLPIWP